MGIPVLREDVLEAMLDQAVSTIEFLHGCLTNPIYSYDYPEQTLRGLEEFKSILPERDFCGHSITQQDCKSCQHGIRWREVMAAWRDGRIPTGDAS